MIKLNRRFPRHLLTTAPNIDFLLPGLDKLTPAPQVLDNKHLLPEVCYKGRCVFPPIVGRHGRAHASKAARERRPEVNSMTIDPLSSS